MIVALGEIIAIFIVPVWLLYRGIVPARWRLWVLIVFAAAIASIIYIDRTPRILLGIRTDNIGPHVLPYLIFTVIAVVVLFTFARILGYRITQTWKTDRHFLGLFIPISLLQVFAYRSFLIPKLMELSSSAALVIVINALLFAYLHIIYPNRKINLSLAFVGGLGFAWLYYYYPNFYLMSVSHIILNLIAVALGFFTFATKYPISHFSQLRKV